MSALPGPQFAFPGGLELDDNKSQSNRDPIREVPLPSRLVVPLQQHIGTACETIVEVGDSVLKGQVIGRSREYVSAPIHAPSSGRITAIEPRAVAHPSGLEGICVEIELDGEDQWTPLPAPMPDYVSKPVSAVRERIRWAGIVGLGGAAFPTSVKATPGPETQIHTLIVNGAECEPYITCDDRLMRERADQILSGAEILMHLVGANEGIVGIEDNKPEAIAAMAAAIDAGGHQRLRVVPLETRYPSGGEKQLIQLISGLEVPSSALPAEMGFLCQNVGTLVAVHDAVFAGRPLISRVVTVTGAGVANPGNFEARIGTSLDHILAAAGGYNDRAARLILGGPMMGFALRHDQVPLTKGGNCVLVAGADEAPTPPPARPCIRCGKCAEVCPASLLPQQLYWYARAKDLDKSQDYHLFDCIECGCCSYVCPSQIPLVQYYRYAKTEIWNQEREKYVADIARRRHEARLARLARLEAERKARARRKQKALDKQAAGGEDAKKAVIEAAMKRVAAKKAERAKEEGGA